MIASSRILKLKTQGETEIRVDIFVPEQESDGAWFCRYEINWPEGQWASRAGGADSMQALFLAMQMIGAEIYASEYHKAGLLYLEEPGRGYGFPVPANLRDLLVGDDKKHI